MAQTRERLEDEPQRPNPPVKPSEPATTGETVIVACKLPHGLQLRVFDWETKYEPTPSGAMKEERMAFEIENSRFVIRGPNMLGASQLPGGVRNELLPGGYALTEGVPKDIWDKWLEQNKHSPLVKNHVVMAYPSLSAARRESNSNAATKSGMEPLDPANPSARLGGVDRRLKISVLDQENK